MSRFVPRSYIDKAMIAYRGRAEGENGIGGVASRYTRKPFELSEELQGGESHLELTKRMLLKAQIEKIEHFLNLKKTRETVACKIQFFYRRYRRKKVFPKRLNASIEIQRAWRMRKVRRLWRLFEDAQRYKKNALKIENAFLKMLLRNVVNSGKFLLQLRIYEEFRDLCIKNREVRNAAKYARRWRGRAAARKLKKDEEMRKKMEKMAVNIQRNWRGRQARKEVSRLCEDRIRRVNEATALLVIKRLFADNSERRKQIFLQYCALHWLNLGQSRLAEKITACTLIQKNWKKRQMWLSEKEHLMAVRIQSKWRQKMARERLLVLKTEKRALLALQCLAVDERRVQVRVKRIAMRFKENVLLSKQKKNEATISIQSLFRGRVAKKEADLLREQKKLAGDMAVKLQAAWRGKRGRQEGARLKVLKEKASHRAKCAEAIQNLLLNQDQKNRALLIRLTSSWRRHILDLHEAKLKMEEERYLAATKLQSAYRGCRARNDLCVQNQAVLVVQASFRGMLGRRQAEAIRRDLIAFEETLVAIEIVQGAWKNRFATKNLSVRKLQVQWRRNVARKKLKQKMETRAALKIQVAWRKRQMRKRERYLHKMATKIQTVWRARQARRQVKTYRAALEFAKLRQRTEDEQRELCARRLQRWYRSRKYQREIERIQKTEAQLADLAREVYDTPHLDVDSLIQEEGYGPLGLIDGEREEVVWVDEEPKAVWLPRNIAETLHLSYLDLEDLLLEEVGLEIEEEVEEIIDLEAAVIRIQLLWRARAEQRKLRKIRLKRRDAAARMIQRWWRVESAFKRGEVEKESKGLKTAGSAFLMGQAYGELASYQAQFTESAVRATENLALLGMTGERIETLQNRAREKGYNLVAREAAARIEELKRELEALERERKREEGNGTSDEDEGSEAVAITGGNSVVPGFHLGLADHNTTRFEEGGLVARYKIKSLPKKNQRMSGVTLTASPLPLRHSHSHGHVCYFEVEVVETLRGAEDGLTIGVTLTSPASLIQSQQRSKGKHESPIETCDAIPNVWAVGYDGQAYNSNTEAFSKIHWRPQALEVGDRVGVYVVCRQGDLLVVQNGEIVAELSGCVPDSKELWGVVDLIGSAQAVRWVKDAQPPEIAFEGDSSPEPSAPRFSPLRHESTVALNSARKVEGGFYPGAHSKVVSLHSDNCVAVYALDLEKGPDGIAQGGVFSAQPLSPVDQFGSLYFEVEVMAVVPGNPHPDGLVIGFTGSNPSLLRPPFPETIDAVPETVCVGYDHLMYDFRTDEMSSVEWSPKDLQVGDFVGCYLVGSEGDVLILVNGEIQCEGPSKVFPSQFSKGKVWGAVDLLGNCQSVRWVPSPRLPAIEIA